MCTRSILGCGFLAGLSLVVQLSLLLKHRRSARGAWVPRQRAPGRPGGPASVLLRLMQIETNENRAFASLWHEGILQVYIPGICKGLEYVRHMPDICLRYDTIRIPDEGKTIELLRTA
jgi:hypothetical protein